MAVTGHAETHAGSSQCMHCRLAKMVRRPPGNFEFSISWSVTTTRVLAESTLGFCIPRAPSGRLVFSAGNSFHSLHETWHERQPMHWVVSINIALDTCASPRVIGACHFHEASLTLLGSGAWINRVDGQNVGAGASAQAFESPVVWHPHDHYFLAVDVERLHALGDHRLDR